MAGIGNSFFDLIDLYKSQEPNGQISTVIEMLTEMNPILDDAIAVECNNGTKHKHTVRTGLPPVTWGKLYQGIPQGKSTKAQVEDTTGFVEALSTIDERLLNLASNPGAVRLSEAQSFLESMNQEVATKIFYGNSNSDPEQFMGLAPRFNALTGAQNSNQVISAAGASTDNASIWFVTWGDNQCQLLYPKGTQAGVKRADMGRQRVLDADGNAYYAMEEMFSWHVGLAVRDWRYVVRICNIDVSNALDGSVQLFNYLRTAFYRLQSRRVPGGRTVIYCNRDIKEALDRLSSNAGSADSYIRLRPMEIQGKEVDTYRGIPVRETDALLSTEAVVS